MEDAFKVLRPDRKGDQTEGEFNQDSPFGDAVHKPAQESIDAPPTIPEEGGLPKSAAALNRWLANRQQLGRSGLVNILNETLVSQFGPLKMKGNITLIHEDGRVELANQLTLCRCGHSRSKPYCDGGHIDAEFKDSGRFSQGSHAPRPLRPASLTVTCTKDGPLEFQGRMRVYDYLGQECNKPAGKLCRCGFSANKPYCDGSHARLGWKSTNPKEH